MDARAERERLLRERDASEECVRVERTWTSRRAMVVVVTLAAMTIALVGSLAGRRWNGLGARVGETPVYVIADARPSKDMDRANESIDAGVDALARGGWKRTRGRFRTVAATFPREWPRTMEVASSVLHAGFYRGGKCCLANMTTWKYPFSAVKAGEQNNRCAGSAYCDDSLIHHVGCIVSHMRTWLRATMDGAQKFVVWESDATSHASVNVLDYDELAQRLPADADMVWLHLFTAQNGGAGPFVAKFPSKATGKWT